MWLSLQEICILQHTDRHPARPPQNDVDSESDDDYEAWGEFDNFNDESSVNLLVLSSFIGML